MEEANGHQNGNGIGVRRTRGGNNAGDKSKQTTDEKLAGDQAKLREKKLKELEEREALEIIEQDRIFRKEQEDRKRAIQQKRQAERDMILQQIEERSANRKVMAARMKQEKAEELHKQKIVLEKNIFDRKFPGPQTVRNTIKMRISPRFKAKTQPKCKKFSITANSNHQVFKIQEEQSEANGFLSHLNSQRNLPSKPSVTHAHFDSLATRVLSFDKQ